jgi:hypothetical protein
MPGTKFKKPSRLVREGFIILSGLNYFTPYLIRITVPFLTNGFPL